jgi:hypothetical protein
MLGSMRAVFASLMLLLAACSAAPARPHDSAEAARDRVDDTCVTDADCAVKNVGNCCGYYPACVNRNSPTFPDRVKAECVRKGEYGVCGFPQIKGCACVEGRCENHAEAATR